LIPFWSSLISSHETQYFERYFDFPIFKHLTKIDQTPERQKIYFFGFLISVAHKISSNLKHTLFWKKNTFFKKNLNVFNCDRRRETLLNIRFILVAWWTIERSRIIWPSKVTEKISLGALLFFLNFKSMLTLKLIN